MWTMKHSQFIFIKLMLAFSIPFIMSSCSNNNKNIHPMSEEDIHQDRPISGNIVIVKKHVNDKDSEVGGNFKLYKKNTNRNQVSEIKKVIKNIVWSQGMPSMSRIEDYRFHFENSTGKVTSEHYKLWISPTGKNIELLTQAHYVQLDPSKSETLFNLLTGKPLSK